VVAFLRNVPSHIFCFTVDVEESFPGGALAAKFFVDIFARYNIRGTFFATAEAIDKYPDLILRIIDEGHEIASHGYSHYHSSDKRPRGSGILDHLSHDELRLEVQRSAESGEKLGIRFKGYRAPSFGINEAALNVLSYFFEYDSSFVTNSLNHRRCFSQITKMAEEGKLRVFPVSRTPVLKIPMGGPYLLGLSNKAFLKNLFRLLPVEEPVIYYAHSFESMPLTRAGQRISPIKWFWYENRCGRNINEYYASFIETLLSLEFGFVRMDELLTLPCFSRCFGSP